MGYLGEQIGKLGFGLMRLPMKDGAMDIPQICEMTDLFLDAGFTYFDTAYGYAEGKSEEAFKAAVVDRYDRDKYVIATKLPAWSGANSAEEARQMFWTSLRRTGVEYFDFYLLHNVGQTRTKAFDDYAMWDYVKELKEKGLARHIGFSFHDKAELLDELLTKHPEMEFVQLQLNYGDWESGTVQSRLCYEVARKHNKPIVIMEPVKGGMLAEPVDSVKAILDAANPGASYASWALRFAASLEGIVTVLSGMSNVAQMKDNIAHMKAFKPLSEAEQAVIVQVRETLAQLPGVPCTGCDYCIKECPQNIVIPKIFEAMNRQLVYNNPGSARFGYMWETQFGEKASKCIECGACEAVCPQQIEIIDTLKDAVAMFETENPA